MIEIVGPRGVASGHQVLRDWLERAGQQLDPRRVFARAESVVVACHGVWRAPAGQVAGEADMALRFRVDGGRVTRFARHERLDDALAEGGLALIDEARREHG